MKIYKVYVKVYQKMYQQVYQTFKCTSVFKKATLSPRFEISRYDSNQQLIPDLMGFESNKIITHK